MKCTTKTKKETRLPFRNGIAYIPDFLSDLRNSGRLPKSFRCSETLVPNCGAHLPSSRRGKYPNFVFLCPKSVGKIENWRSDMRTMKSELRVIIHSFHHFASPKQNYQIVSALSVSDHTQKATKQQSLNIKYHALIADRFEQNALWVEWPKVILGFGGK